LVWNRCEEGRGEKRREKSEKRRVSREHNEAFSELMLLILKPCKLQKENKYMDP